MNIEKRLKIIEKAALNSHLFVYEEKGVFTTSEEAFRKLQLTCKSLKEDKLPEAFKVFEKEE